MRGRFEDHRSQARVRTQTPKLKAIQTANGKGQMANGLGFEKSANCKPLNFRCCPNLVVAPPSWRLHCRLEAGVTRQIRTLPDFAICRLPFEFALSERDEEASDPSPGSVNWRTDETHRLRTPSPHEAVCELVFAVIPRSRGRRGISHCLENTQSEIPRGVYPEHPERDPSLRSG